MSIKITIPGSILIDPKLQILERSDTFGDPQLDFADSFATNGWDDSQGIVKVFAADEATLARCLDYRRERMAAWAQAPLIEHEVGLTTDGGKRTLTGQQLYDEAKSVWCKDGNLVTDPSAFVGVANCCNRRLFAEIACVVSYRHKNPEAKGTYSVPYKIVVYDDDDAKRDDRVQENAKTGTRSYSLIAMLYIAVDLVRRGFTETDVHQRLGFSSKDRGKSQKLHTWAVLCRKFIKSDLLARFQLPRPKLEKGQVLRYQGTKGYLDFAKVTPSQGRTLLARCKKPAAMDDIVVAAFGGEREISHVATSEEMEKFLKLLHNGAVNAKKIMSKAHLEVLKGSAPSGLLENLMTAITVDDSEGVSAMYDAYMEHEADQSALIQELKARIEELEGLNASLVTELEKEINSKGKGKK